MQVIVREELPHPTMKESIPVKVMKAEKLRVFFNAIVNNKRLNTSMWCSWSICFNGSLFCNRVYCSYHSVG